MDLNKLDNPVWYSLTETHSHLALEYNGIRFYNPDYSPFGGFIDLNATSTGINEYANITDNFYVVGDRPFFNDRVVLKNELSCNQMIADKIISVPILESICELKTEKQLQELFDLVNLVQPGYFRAKTSKLGNYFGIYKDEKLVAVTGERMKMNGFTEISAVVTHPNYIGLGYATQLVSFTVDKICKEGISTYLHVADSNTAAIKLYEKLGFVTRRKISFWNFGKVE